MSILSYGFVPRRGGRAVVVASALGCLYRFVSWILVQMQCDFDMVNYNIRLLEKGCRDIGIRMYVTWLHAVFYSCRPPSYFRRRRRAVRSATVTPGPQALRRPEADDDDDEGEAPRHGTHPEIPLMIESQRSASSLQRACVRGVILCIPGPGHQRNGGRVSRLVFAARGGGRARALA